MKKKISQMTEEEALNEQVIDDIRKLIQKARKKEQAAAEAHNAVFKALEDLCIDIDVPSVAENAETLGDAVSCFIQYGEFGLRNLLKEIRAQYEGKKGTAEADKEDSYA